jgi:hypothetical protein
MYQYRWHVRGTPGTVVSLTCRLPHPTMKFNNGSAIHMTTPRLTTGKHARSIRFAIVAAALLLFGSPAFANTYLFSFTVSQVMTALQTSEGSAAFDESAYFAIFAQPNPAVVSGYSYSSETAPNPTDPNAWVASTITDPSSPNLGYSSGAPCTSNCTWADFYKGPSQTSVTLISGANGGSGGSNIFQGTTWFSFSTPPYGWGFTTATISAIMPGADTFQFLISTTASLTSSTYSVLGYASELQSGSPTTRTGDTKEDHGIAFTLNASVSPVTVPDPSPAVLTGGGAAVLFLLARRRGLLRRPSRSA